jgi:hypothetical protein
MLKKFLLGAFLIFATACSGSDSILGPDESGSESATPVTVSPEEGDKDTTSPFQRLLLNQAMLIRYEKNGVLEAKVELPTGTQIEIPREYEIRHLDFRNTNGSIERSSTGFVFGVKVVSVASEFQSQFPRAKINQLNATTGGLYIFASIVGNLAGTEGNFAVLEAAATAEGFLKQYSPVGKPRFRYTNSVIKRFGSRLNRGVDMEVFSASEKAKWQSIYAELRRAENRKVATSKSYLMMEKSTAAQASVRFEKTGAITPWGAWSIAVQSTAPRHGFANVPCAEFQSEILRQAYQRAGYRVSEDFNNAKGNPLIWHNTAAVVNFSMALYKAGWVPWDSTVYKPMTGAFLMNGSGNSPGHTYIAAGDDGMIIVDNGAPQGRDLRKTSERTLGMMYQTGVFFLPPGVNPQAWEI